MTHTFAEYRLFHRALLQKRPTTLRSLLIIATPYELASLFLSLAWPLSFSRSFSRSFSLSFSRVLSLPDEEHRAGRACAQWIVLGGLYKLALHGGGRAGGFLLLSIQVCSAARPNQSFIFPYWCEYFKAVFYLLSVQKFKMLI